MARRTGAVPTIKDVAKHASVSIGTVSRVLNAHKDVDADLRRRVEASIRVLGYRPNVRAQSFVRDRSPTVGFVLCNRGGLNPFHSLLLQGVEEYCAEAGHYVLFARHQYAQQVDSNDLQLPGVILSRGLAECVIVAGRNYDNFLELLDRLGISYVVFANNVVSTQTRRPVNQVRYDDYTGCYEATRYLIQLGHKDIWYIGDSSQPWFQARHEAYARAMVDHQLEPRAQTVALSDDPFENGHAAASLILEQGFLVTAVLAGTDELAYGVKEGLRLHGREVPRDVSLIGFNHQVARTRIPSLTSVCVDAVEVGRQLGKMAIAKIESRGEDVPEVVVPTVLVKRGTCRPFRPEQGMVL